MKIPPYESNLRGNLYPTAPILPRRISLLAQTANSSAAFRCAYPELPLTLMHIQRPNSTLASRQSRHNSPTSPSITNRILMLFWRFSLSYFANHHFCARPAVFLLNSIFSHNNSIVCLWNFFNIFSSKFYYFSIFKPTVYKILCILHRNSFLCNKIGKSSSNFAHNQG